MDTPIEALPDDIDALPLETLRALLVVERQNVLMARAEVLQAEALAAIAQAQVADAHAIIEELKLRIAKARPRQMGPVFRAPQAVARSTRDATRGRCHRRDGG